MRPLLLLLPALASAARPAVVTQANIEYAEPAGHRLLLDACVPDGPGPFPAVILVHGGAWRGGSRHGDPRPLMRPLTAAGFAWFSIDYRLGPAFHFPACVDDVESAIRWVRAHAAAYHIDRRRIALLGESAGGQIVAMAAERATPETRVAAVVDLYGPSDLVLQERLLGRLGRDVSALLGCTSLDGPALQELRAASPVFGVRPGMPPFLVMHGTADRIVAYDESVEFVQRLRASGVPCEFVTITGGSHAMGNWGRVEPGFKQRIVAWLQKILGSPVPRVIASAVGGRGAPE